MKVLVATPYFSPKIGGLETYAENLAVELKSQGWEVILVCGDSVESVTQGTFKGIKIYRLPIWKTLSNTPINLAWWFMMRRIIRIERPDVINAHTPVPFMVDITLLAAGRTPVIVTYHAATLFKEGSLVMRLVTDAYLFYEGLTFRRARRLVAVSPYVKQALEQRFSIPISVVTNAVKVPVSTPAPPGNGLVFVANLERTHAWKGLDLILEAMSVSVSSGTPFPHLTVIGDGSYKSHYEVKAKAMGIDKHIFFAGKLTGALRDDEMSKSAALIAYPVTANDAFPTVFLEAWALNLPIIAAAIGPIPSLIEHGVTGLLVEPGQPVILSQALAAAFENPSELAKMGKSGRRLIESEYNWPIQAAKMNTILKEAI